MSRESEARGRHIRAIRISRNFTQRRLAIACDCTVSTISQIENGRFESISERMLAALSKALDVPADSLLARQRKSPNLR